MTAADPVSTQIGQWQQRSLLVGHRRVLLLVAGFLILDRGAIPAVLSVRVISSGPEWRLGCLGILLLHHTVGGKWGMLIRRMCEAGARTLPYMIVLLIPILAEPADAVCMGASGSGARRQSPRKAAYLNVPGVIGRAVFYFLVWTFLRVPAQQVVRRAGRDRRCAPDRQNARASARPAWWCSRSSPPSRSSTGLCRWSRTGSRPSMERCSWSGRCWRRSRSSSRW